MFELDAMAVANRSDQWDRTAMNLAQRFNAHRSKKQSERKPVDFHPFASFSELFRVSGVSNPEMWEAVKEKWTR